MNDDFTPNRPDFTGGVKSTPYKPSSKPPDGTMSNKVIYGFYGFYGFSLKGYVRARPHADYPSLQREPVKSVKSVKCPSPSGDRGFTPRCKIGENGCKIGGGRL